jgi:hypothetical protein
MKSEEWKTYRTRFLVNAKQLNSTLSFVDHLGRQHRGRKGDYLVESSDGVLSIAPRRIFEDIYVSIAVSDAPGALNSPLSEPALSEPVMESFKFEPLDITEVKLDEPLIGHECPDQPFRVGNREPLPARRKHPQSSSDRRVSAPHLRLM